MTETPTTENNPPMLKKSDLFDRVLARTDVKKRDAKPAIETALAVIADALIAGEDMNLPPLGKLRVVRSKELDNGANVLTLKLRTPNNASQVAAVPSPPNTE